MNSLKKSEIKKDLILTDSDGNRFNFNSVCKSLKHSKLGMGDIKELTDVILKSLNKMSYNEKQFQINNDHNHTKDLSGTLESIYESKSDDYRNMKCNTGNSLLSDETLSKSNFKGYDGDMSKSMSSSSNNNLRFDFRSHLNENYFQRTFNHDYHRLSNFTSHQNNSISFGNTETKTSSSGVYSESPPENSDFDNEYDLNVVTRIIEDSYNIDNDYNDSDSDTQIDELYEYSDDSNCESENNAGGVSSSQANLNRSYIYSNRSDSNSDILNRSATAWLSQCRNGCDCSKCYIDRLIRKAEISCLNEQSNSSSFSQFYQNDKTVPFDRSSTPFRRTKRTYLNEIMSDSSQLPGDSLTSTSSSNHYCTENFCLICMKNSKRKQLVQKLFQL